jgi:hypothetical protein
MTTFPEIPWEIWRFRRGGSASDGGDGSNLGGSACESVVSTSGGGELTCAGMRFNFKGSSGLIGI